MKLTLIIFSFISISMILSLATGILIGVWVYKDAKERKNKDALLWTLATIFIPYLLGFIAYLIFARNNVKRKCESCGYYNSIENTFCSKCGSELNFEKPNEDNIKNNNKILLAAIVTFILAITFIIGAGIVAFRNMDGELETNNPDLIENFDYNKVYVTENLEENISDTSESPYYYTVQEKVNATFNLQDSTKRKVRIFNLDGGLNFKKIEAEFEGENSKIFLYYNDDSEPAFILDKSNLKFVADKPLDKSEKEVKILKVVLKMNKGQEKLSIKLK